MKLRKSETHELELLELAIERLSEPIDDEILNPLRALVLPLSNCIPEFINAFRNYMFNYARIIKTIELKRINRSVTSSELESLYELWKLLAEDKIGHDTLLYEFFTDFTSIYLSTKVPHDEGIVEEAARRAKESPPVKLPMKRIDKHTQFLANICLELHRLSCGGAFHLAVRKANEFIPSLSPQSINNKLRTLTFFGVLEEIEKGQLVGRKASKYRYLLDDYN